MQITCSQLEYASSIWHPYKKQHIIWHPYKKQHIIAIENVQRRATKYLPELEDLDYPDRLAKLNLHTLTYRGTRGDMIETYKIVHNVYDSKCSDIFRFRSDMVGVPRTRGHPYKIFPEQCKLLIIKRKYWFLNRVITL